ncbi:putative lipopolysaccharide biosynthesis protein [Betaproteobacteria bacterium]|nr:putative lipopolysaccharide biosynthesis protein [Betaproteobacteria bacterium]GHU41018.1 putative lipopolysaccharide biosynthesis protein [Betaproteobacteria bacterium]
MSIGSRLYCLTERSHAVLIRYILPLGWLLLLTGMFWLWDRNLYIRSFYLFLALPGLLVLMLRPERIWALVRQPVFVAFALFATYMLITLAWSDTSKSAGSLIARPFYIALLLLGVGLLALRDVQKLERILHIAGWVAVANAIGSFVYFLYGWWFSNGTLRLQGYGLFDNPLIGSHVYGAFAAYWLARWFLAERDQRWIPLICLTILGVFLVASGSRTPFLGLCAALLWLALSVHSRRALSGLLAIALFVLMQYLYSSSLHIWAGVSYRPAVWMNVLQQISTAPWFGHGYDASMTIVVPGIEPLYSNAHNMELGVLYAGGVFGLALWMGIYICALSFAWKYRREQSVLIASTWLIFGAAAGLTEGSSFLSRPKEHWFLVWIPIALLFAYSAIQRHKEQAGALPEKT